jgi:CHAD domain-containing protein
MTTAVIEYYNKHRQLILDNLRLSAGRDNIDPVHDMRVSFKRLKILLQFLEILSDGKVKAKDEYAHFNKFYKISGKLRDLHVQKLLLDFYIESKGRSYIEYSDFLSDCIQESNNKYQAALREFDTSFFEKNFDQLFESILIKTSDKMIIGAAEKILNSKSIGMRKSYRQGKDEKRFHEIRRSLKDLQYLNNMLKDELPVEKALNVDSNKLTEAGQLLGSWHDKFTAEIVLSGFVRNHSSELDDVNVYSILLKQIERDKNAEYQHLDNFFINEIKLG